VREEMNGGVVVDDKMRRFTSSSMGFPAHDLGLGLRVNDTQAANVTIERPKMRIESVSLELELQM